jgi:hypothetical protein
MSPAETRAYRSLFPRPAHRGFIMGRAFVDGQAVHADDVLEDPDYDSHTLKVLQRAAPYRTFLAIRILRNRVPIGVIGCGGHRALPGRHRGDPAAPAGSRAATLTRGIAAPSR